jgi:hypothetical protein
MQRERPRDSDRYGAREGKERGNGDAGAPTIDPLLPLCVLRYPPIWRNSTASALLTGVLAESADTVAGPCASSPTTPCSPATVTAKLFLRNYCYAENHDGACTAPWPYAIPICNASTGKPPLGWSGCLPGPEAPTWLYHYFTETPPQNQGIEARGAAWYIGRAAAALRAGNVTSAAALLGCFGHGLEDRSSPYHAFGGAEVAKAAIEAKYNLTATCQAHAPPASVKRCEILFWSADDSNLDVTVPGYTPLVLGASLEEIGAVVGGRMEELATSAREFITMPGGYIETHLNDSKWWTGKASAATRAVESRMAQMSTRLVADAWHTAWTLAQSNVSVRVGQAGRTPQPISFAPASLIRWSNAVDVAAALDRLESAGMAL